MIITEGGMGAILHHRAMEKLLIERADMSFEPEMGLTGDMVRDICKWRGVTKAQLISPERTRYIARARQEVAYWLRVKKGLSYRRIGIIFNQDHTSAIRSAITYAKRHSLPLELHGVNTRKRAA